MTGLCCLQHAQSHTLTCTAINSDTTPSSSTTTNGALLDIDATTYFRDAEYLSPFCTGSTYPGFRLTPTLLYQPDSQFTIQAGIMLNCIAGVHGIYQWAPTLSIQYRPTPWISLAVGSFSTSSHHLESPLISSERWFTTPTEGGFRLTTGLERWQSETWLDWEHFLVPWTEDQEIFNAGTVHQLTLFHSHTDNQLFLQGAYLVRHHGGELTTLDTIVETIYNQMFSLNLRHTLEPSDTILIKLPIYFFQNPLDGIRSTHYQDGWGIHPQITLTTPLSTKNNWSLVSTLGFWRGHQWEAPLGDYLFQSVSMYRPDAFDPSRRMITFGAYLTQKKPQFQFQLETQLFYDIEYHNLDLLVGLFLKFHHTTPLARR